MHRLLPFAALLAFPTFAQAIPSPLRILFPGDGEVASRKDEAYLTESLADQPPV